MNDLIAWLNAQIDEDEDAALGAKGDSSGVWADDGSPVPPDCVVLYDRSGRLTVGQHRHMVRHDPDRVLRQVAAHRKLLDLHAEVYRDVGWLEDGDERMAELPVCGHCVPRHSWFNSRAEVPAYPCVTVLIVAEGRGLVP